jgi:uncharacterized protein (DUF488 family)
MTQKHKLICTIGHSSRTWQEFLEILRAHEVRAIADVRRFPGSRKYPHFNSEVLRATLNEAEIDYAHFPDLGGRRPASKRASNTGWRNQSFRGYADYMQTPEFAKALTALQQYAKKQTTAIMCAEAVPWRCHRSLISDALIVRDWKVFDITGKGKPSVHKLTPFAKVAGNKITYPAYDEAPLFADGSAGEA